MPRLRAGGGLVSGYTGGGLAGTLVVLVALLVTMAVILWSLLPYLTQALTLPGAR
jgi:hypothetical protein